MSGSYSDHGTPDVSTVASTHPGQSVGDLAVTGFDLTPYLYVAVLLIACGALVVLLAGKRQRRGVAS